MPLRLPGLTRSIALEHTGQGWSSRDYQLTTVDLDPEITSLCRTRTRRRYVVGSVCDCVVGTPLMSVRPRRHLAGRTVLMKTSGAT